MNAFLYAFWLLLLGAWLGTNAATTMLSAPSVFAFVENGRLTSELAGTIVGEILARQATLSLVGLPVILAGSLLLLRYRPESRRRQAVVGLLCLCLLLLLLEIFYITPQIQDLRAQIRNEFGSFAEAPENDPLRTSFMAFHGLSMVRSLIVLGLGALAFILGSIRPPD